MSKPQADSSAFARSEEVAGKGAGRRRPSAATFISNPFRAVRLGGFMPFMWYGMRLGPWLRLLAAARFRISLNRLPNVVGVTLFAIITSLVYLASEAVFRRKAEKIKVVAPVFVLGHWRSGTTFLHNLLTRDPATAYPTTFECSLPNGFLIFERPAGWIFSLFLPSKRPTDEVPVGADMPFEDEFALPKIGVGSPYERFAVPDNEAIGSRYLDLADLTEQERTRWQEGFLWLVRRLQLAHRGKRLVLKSPPHTARVATLLKLFPDARFVHISRNPFDIYPSNWRLVKFANSRFGLKNPANDEVALPEQILSTLPRMYAAYERDLHLIPPGRLIEMRYEDLAEKPEEAVATIYGGLGLGDFEEIRPIVRGYLAGLGAHRAKEHRLSETERAAIVQRWEFYFRRFGYAHLLPSNAA